MEVFRFTSLARYPIPRWVLVVVNCSLVQLIAPLQSPYFCHVRERTGILFIGRNISNQQFYRYAVCACQDHDLKCHFGRVNASRAFADVLLRLHMTVDV